LEFFVFNAFKGIKGHELIRWYVCAWVWKSSDSPLSCASNATEKPAGQQLTLDSGLLHDTRGNRQGGSGKAHFSPTKPSAPLWMSDNQTHLAKSIRLKIS
jgi:hypothetical protein